MSYQNEKQLQSAMVMKFSQTYPEKNGQLFSVRNTTFSVRDGQTQKAMGMKRGVSDLVFYGQGNMTGIEVKLEGSRHEHEHVTTQYTWGETIIREGGEYFIATSVEGFMSIIEGGELHPDVITLEMLKEKLDTEKKSIVF